MTHMDLVEELLGCEVVVFADGNVHSSGLLVSYQQPCSRKNHRPSVLALKTDAGYVLVRSWFAICTSRQKTWEKTVNNLAQAASESRVANNDAKASIERSPPLFRLFRGNGL